MTRRNPRVSALMCEESRSSRVRQTQVQRNGA